MKSVFESQGTVRRTATVIAFIGIPLTLLGVFVAIRAEFAEARHLRATTETTIASRALLSDMLILHIDAETSVRGYSITKDLAFLAPYQDAMKRRAGLLAALEKVAEPEVVAEFPELQRLSDLKLGSLSQKVAYVRSGRADLAREHIMSGRGKRLMDQLRGEIAHLDRLEATKLRNLSNAGDGARNLVENTVIGLLVSLSLLLAIVTAVIARAFRQRRDALEQAQEYAEHQQALFDGAVDGMLQLDGDGNIVGLNPSISRMFGYGEEELVGRHNMFLMDDNYSLEESNAWLATVGYAGEHGAGRRQEFLGRRADGTVFETEVAISRVSNSGNVRYVAAIRDISDRKRTEKMKTEFVSTVSHELRTPLTSISGSLSLLGAGAVGPLPEKARHLVEIARSNCERLIRLINDILDIEKIESGKMEFDMRRMQVAPLVERTVAAMRGFAEKHDVKLTTTLPPWPQCIVGDPDRLEQLLTNLVSNAIKHSPPGGEVEIYSDHHGGMVRIEVCDRGAGIPLDFRDRIFGKFAMADASDSRVKGGTGLGLSIAREIARRHGGDIGYDDRDGGGTSFHVDLKANDSGDEANATTDPSLPRILHVDDDEDCQSVVASAFAGKAAIVSAGSIKRMESLLDEQKFDGAIIDPQMTSRSGVDLGLALRRKNQNLPIVLFTVEDGAHAGSGADRVLVKSRASLDNLVDVTLRLVTNRKKAA